MAGTGPGDLFALAQEFLDACVDSLDSIPLFEPGLAGAPARSFVSPGQPAYDCCDDGQLTVHVQSISSDPIEPAKNEWRRNMVSLQAIILRCVPSANEGDAPSVESMEEAAEQVDADAWALWNHIFNLIAADQLFTLCSRIIWDGMRSIAVSGNCGGWILSLRVEFDGYQEVIAS